MALLQLVSVITRIQFSEVASLSDPKDCAAGDESTWHSWHRGTNQSTTPRTHILQEGHILALLTPKCTLVSRQFMLWPIVS